MADRIIEYGNTYLDDDGVVQRDPTVIKCDCGARLETILSMDVRCRRCDTLYNASGQVLRSDAPVFGAHGVGDLDYDERWDW